MLISPKRIPEEIRRFITDKYAIRETLSLLSLTKQHMISDLARNFTYTTRTIPYELK